MNFKKLLVSFFAVATVLIPTIAMADSNVSSGSGGKYSYELWRTTNNEYYLKIWNRDSSTQESPSSVTHHFQSSREALDHFDCVYAEKSLPVCPR
jgi:ABC-type long-subunit fatty acid transport system fused permease/ATPase subunit